MNHINPILTEETPQAVAQGKKKRNLIAGAAMVVAIVGTIAVLNLPTWVSRQLPIISPIEFYGFSN